MASSFFKEVPLVPTDEVFALTKAFKDDTHPNKVNLGAGAYRDEEGKPFILPVVANVEAAMCQDKTLNHEYLGIDGLKEFTDAANTLCLGAESPALVENRVCGIQALSGTGALRLGFEFLRKFHSSKNVYVSTPTWGNHKKIIDHAGLEVKSYRYFDKNTRGIDFSGMCTDIENAPEGSVILFHACAHNPSGVDPNKEQWAKLAQIVQEKKLFPFFDMAYQGFVSGDPDTDAWSVRYFVSCGFEVLVAQSFAKIFGIYNERAGNLCIVTASNQIAENIRSQMKAIIRPMYSNPPFHGAYIVTAILNNPALNSEWRDTLRSMAERIRGTRTLFYEKLKALGTPGDWSHIVNQNGMFTFTGLMPKQVDHIIRKYHIYLMKSGRINMCGINHNNVDAVAKAFDETVNNVFDEDPKL